ncbi:MAG TPA: zinc-binding dehydrogenase [Spirochaetes bacterium]|nr:zinc-binding dehydrogenase [Spirochaetota bacterium]
MQAAVWHGADDLRIEDVRTPVLEKGEVLIKVKATGICGTDLMIYKGKFPRARPPLVPGHELAGEIVEVNEVPEGIKTGNMAVVNPLISCGTCVACRMGIPNVCQKLRVLGNDLDGSFAEFVKVSWKKLYIIDDDFPTDKASLVEPSAVAYHGIKRSGCEVGDFVVVQGAGPIGMLTAMVARIAGASGVALTEVRKYRLELAEKLGFIALDPAKYDVVKEIKSLTNNRGADIVVNAAPVRQAAEQMTKLIRPGGKIVVFALYKEPAVVDLLNLTFTEGHVVGSRVYSEIDFERAADLVRSGKLDVGPLITHRLGLKDALEGIEILEKGVGVMKVVLSP